MKAAGIIFTGFLMGFLIFGIVPKTQAASSGVVTATVQIKQPSVTYMQSNNFPSVTEIILASLAIAPQFMAATGSLPVLPFKISLSIKNSQQAIGYN